MKPALPTGRYALLLLLAMILAGLAGNYFKYPIFLNIDFLFGSIFAMLALQFFGVGRGIVAAAVIASYTYVLWNEPYAMIIMTVEVAVVGTLTVRRKMGLVLADALYWMFFGMPLAYCCYRYALDVSLDSTYIIMTKQAVNGIFNALLARLIFTGFALATRSSLIAYRDLIYNLLGFFALIPALLLLMVASRIDFTETDLNIRTELHQNSLRITSHIEGWVQNRVPVMVNLAEQARTQTPRQMQVFLEMATKSDTNYLRMGLADKQATAVAFFPPVDELGKPTIGTSFAERPYLPTLRQSLKPMLSDVFMGKVGLIKPRVVALAPVVSGGEYNGYVFGVLDLEQIRDYLEKLAVSDTLLYTLLDKSSNVILSNRPQQKMMAPLMRGKGSLNRLDEYISQWVPTLPPNTSISERWKSSSYVAESTVGRLAEWTLILEQPVAPFQKMLYGRYSDALVRVLLLLMAALVLAELMSRKVVATTEQLSEMTQNLPGVLATGIQTGIQTVWPETALREPNRLIGNFKTMAATLAAQFSANRQLNATLEQRVEERTRALEASMLELKRSNADLEQFAYAASHDMRQPLRMISSYLQLITVDLEPLLKDQTRQNLHFATEGAQRLDQMLAALLDYSRVGHKNDNKIRFDSRAVLDEALLILRPAIGEAQAAVRIEGEWPQIAADRDEMLRLFQNLIDNALKYRLADRQPDIVVSAQTVAGEWRFAVRDNGVGLLPGQEVRIFKVFERFQPRAKYPGTGIGLALCRKIVEHHGGRIWVESAGENQGCTFIFSLPAAAPEQAGEAPALPRENHE